MSIGLVDTSVFCEIIKVPGMHQKFGEVIRQLRTYIEQSCTILLPIATIIETGNHVAQNGDGTQRRETAQRFVELVNNAINDNIPWTIPKPLFSQDDLAEYLQDFPDNAMREVGLGDLSIIKEFHRQCKLHPARRVFIWSLDRHLMGYERQVPGWVEYCS